ncbi:MAG: hypothetical protein IPJ40_23895 [Saprospirales bacterium]|nr:hypothetical protein [Saprospirales bacterium]
MKPVPISGIILFSLFSCQLEETNINPNDPTDVPIHCSCPGRTGAWPISWRTQPVVAGIFPTIFIG